jgi:predicted nucleic acid-binding protein
MRLLLDTNVLSDALLIRPGKPASEAILNLCESGTHQAIVAWQTLPTVSYYYRRGHTDAETWEMLREMIAFIDVPTVGKSDVIKALSYAITDFEDALQLSCAEADRADAIITRNVKDFVSSPIRVFAPEDFLAHIGVSP